MGDKKKYRVDLHWGVKYTDEGKIINMIDSVDSEETDDLEEAKKWISSTYFGEIYDNETNTILYKDTPKKTIN